MRLRGARASDPGRARASDARSSGAATSARTPRPPRSAGAPGLCARYSVAPVSSPAGAATCAEHAGAARRAEHRSPITRNPRTAASRPAGSADSPRTILPAGLVTHELRAICSDPRPVLFLLEGYRELGAH